MNATAPATIATHNGTFSVTSTGTGTHRTFRVRTQPKDSNFLPGSRIVSMLTGSNNECDYTSFGFVNDNGKINVWRKHQDGFYPRAAKMLSRMAWHIANGSIVVESATKCRVCNRKLTNPESIASGIGPTCEGR